MLHRTLCVAVQFQDCVELNQLSSWVESFVVSRKKNMVDEEHKQEHNGMAKKAALCCAIVFIYIYPFGTWWKSLLNCFLLFFPFFISFCSLPRLSHSLLLTRLCWWFCCCCYFESRISEEQMEDWENVDLIKHRN